MDLKVDEKLIKEKLKKKKLRSSKKLKNYHKKTSNFGRDITVEIKEVASSENSENISEILDDISPKIQSTPETKNKNNQFTNKISDKFEFKKRKKQDLKYLIKVSHILSNIIYLTLKEFDIEKLQHYTSLINIMHNFLSTDISHNSRAKEKTKLATKSSFWLNDIDCDFDKFDQVCEGIDNIENINRHFEKILFEQYKAKQRNMLQAHSGILLPLNTKPHNHSDKQKRPVRVGNQQNSDINNTNNTRIVDSTVLHFSTTYENTNSSAFTVPDESIDSIDELNLNQNTICLEKILLPENIVYFKIFDLFSLISEKTHEQLNTQSGNGNISTDRINEEQINNNNINNNPVTVITSTNLATITQQELNSPTRTLNFNAKALAEKEKAMALSNLTTSRSEDTKFKIYVKGLLFKAQDENYHKFLKKKSSKLL